MRSLPSGSEKKAMWQTPVSKVSPATRRPWPRARRGWRRRRRTPAPMGCPSGRRTASPSSWVPRCRSTYRRPTAHSQRARRGEGQACRGRSCGRGRVLRGDADEVESGDHGRGIPRDAVNSGPNGHQRRVLSSRCAKRRCRSTVICDSAMRCSSAGLRQQPPSELCGRVQAISSDRDCLDCRRERCLLSCDDAQPDDLERVDHGFGLGCWRAAEGIEQIGQVGEVQRAASARVSQGSSRPAAIIASRPVAMSLSYPATILS